MWRAFKSLCSLWLLLAALPALVACGPAESTPAVTATALPATPTAASTKSAADQDGADPYTRLRVEMVQTQMMARDISDERVLGVMAQVPRHEFVPAEYDAQAYDDHPLPIGHGQTISQPYIVALMTQLIDLQPGEKVLEIGTGSGYQAAVLAGLTDQVYTIEIIPELAESAQATFKRLGYDKIVAKQADGYWGWEEYAPFDAIIVTAAPDHVPQPLVKQLADGGIMVIPVGPPGGYQSLWVLERRGEEILRSSWGAVSFVPFTRAAE